MGRQWVEGVDENLQKQRNLIDVYFPIFTMLQVSIFLNTQNVCCILDFGCREHPKSVCLYVEALGYKVLHLDFDK
jgi:hypothetical protein